MKVCSTSLLNIKHLLTDAGLYFKKTYNILLMYDHVYKDKSQGGGGMASSQFYQMLTT